MLDSKIRFWSIITSRLFITIAISAIVIIGIAITKNLLRRAELSKEIKALSAKIQSYEQKNQELSDLMIFLQSTEFKEKEARLRYGLRKPDEQVVILPLDQTEKSDSLSSGFNNSVNESNWQKWWNHFFKI
ncbi:MAG: septum formation initiator family protein [Patescibacteria group bacterium]